MSTAAPASAAAAAGPSGGTRDTVSRGSCTKGKGCAGGRTGGNRASGRGSSPVSIVSTTLGSRPLYDQIPRPSFAFCIKCIAEAALRPPVSTVAVIKYDWDCVNSVSCFLCKKDSNNPSGLYSIRY